MKTRGPKPKLAFADQTKLVILQHHYGIDSKEVEEFWEKKRKESRHRRKHKHSRRNRSTKLERKYGSWAEAHRVASKNYYERNKERLKKKARQRYKEKKQKEKA